MLDDYKEEQPIAYKIMLNAVKKNKSSHAYLIVANGYPRQLNLALDFSKYLLCPYGYSNNKLCQACHQCQKIDDGNFTEIKMVEPAGLQIKKDQIKDLKKEFSKKAIDSKQKIYIIDHADQMNETTANSILKFLEEPEPNITAILLTDNLYQILSTIISRCQIIALRKTSQGDLKTINKIANFLYNNDKDISNYINDDHSQLEIESVLAMLKYLEQNKLDTLLKSRSLWHTVFDDKISSERGYTILLLFYKDILNYKLLKQVEYMDDFVDDIIKIANSNSVKALISKITIILNSKKQVKNNANLSLLFDKLVIEMSDIDD